MSVADERLVHLRAAGLLRDVKGIVFGQLSLDRSEEDEFEDFLLDLVSDLDVPILMDFPAGHEVPNLTLPFGTEVEIVADGTTGWLTYKEDALSSCGACRERGRSSGATSLPRRRSRPDQEPDASSTALHQTWITSGAPPESKAESLLGTAMT